MNSKAKEGIKLTLAAVGACAGMGFAVWLAWSYFGADKSTGPSQLTLHPADQERILAERRALEFKERLNLTDEQATQVTRVIMELREDVRRMRAENAGSMKGRQAMRQTLMRELDKKIVPILTPEQQALYQERKADFETRAGQLQQFRQRFAPQQNQGE
ncbi:MAG TPA: hypothetical protein ENN29_12245 [Candidatus Hydrogenedentes bacterium]|mgnify:CR=1 FL=1|nr:hypothetical protein [Candidatus Hydrogenedentota bacterium]